LDIQRATDALFDLKDLLENVPMTVAQRSKATSRIDKIKAELSKGVKFCECY